ncbi:hypothetical protein NO995_06935 [Aestuariibaculum sp. M13]|uniref:hypothetical protein n=1 Tax=Aestuariibaculum sp. M13 TaxID=2967132 RepID=UPI002159C67D|nr:hypothetical protein [Aestuariibaculum sp. M13]MCR8667408.1 hypothetical protein [Aestuariibaculum sp. M13]
MKTLILIWFIGLTNLAYSQTILFKDAIPETIAEAIILSEVEISNAKSALIINNLYLDKSTEYLSFIFGDNIPENIIDVQRLIAQYDIKKLKSDCPSCDKFKAIVQGLKDSKAVIVFNKDGQIIETYETYKNIYPPLDVKDKLLSTHPNWSTSKSSLLFIYEKSENKPRSRYMVDLINADNSQKLTFNLSD